MINVSHIRNINEGNIRCISIDPGSKTMGFSIVELNVNTWEVSLLRCETINASDMMGQYADLVDTLGERLCRNLGYNEFMKKMLRKWHIDFVACESAYMGKFVKAYQSLTEHVTLLKAAVYNHDRKMTFLMIEPSVIKKAMGVKGNSGDKSLMTKALANRKSVTVCDTITIATLDEHSVDSACIGICTMEKIKENMKSVVTTN